jgi:two-component system phosphate regulon sensor histidine kinase PhoR
VLRARRSFVWAAASVAVASLALAAQTELQSFDMVAGGRSALGALHLTLYAVGAVGVIFLGLSCSRLAGVVTSIARQLVARASNDPENTDRDGADELSEAVGTYVTSKETLVRQLRHDLDDLRIRARLSEQQKRHTEAIIYSLRDAVVVADEQHRLVMANEPAAALLGFDTERSRGKSLAEICGDAHREFVEFLRQSAQSRAEGTRREMGFTLGDQPHTFDTIVSCVREGEKVFGVVAVLHDVTREKEISQIKNDFVSHVSHELKTPLASITAYSEMLVDGEANNEETRKEFYGVIQSQAQRLNRLIEDILNISRIESGLIKVHKEPVSLAVVIEQQMNMIEKYAAEKNIAVTRQTPIIFDQVYADKDMLAQVIVNLLSNAIKYTPVGGAVRIATDVDEAAGLAKVAITDTGVGIPADELEHLFGKFYRVAANNKHAQGTGLGLNLVKQIVEKVHNGRVFVTSQVGVGSTFGFELPLAAAAMAPA